LKEDKRIVKYDVPTDSPEMDIFGQRILERMMILPLGHKYSSQSPYIDLLNQFRTYLRDEQLLIMIGYSFRDLAVNNALVDRTNKITSGDSTTKFKIILVDERAKDVIIKNVPNESQKVFTPVNTSFEGTNTLNEIINAIRERQCGDGLMIMIANPGHFTSCVTIFRMKPLEH
jgi:hypothetical protein